MSPELKAHLAALDGPDIVVEDIVELDRMDEAEALLEEYPYIGITTEMEWI